MEVQSGEATVKYKRCPRCELNYILESEQLCHVCKDELAGKKSIFDDESLMEFICPYCEKNPIDIDDIMCSECRAKRSKKGGNV